MRAPVSPEATTDLCPFSVTVDHIAGMLNFEIADDPVYEGFELQWFDDDRHGTGMLALLSRRDGRVVDYYQQPGLRLERSGYQIAGGTGGWHVTDFDAAVFQVTPEGVRADVRFTDVDGRLIEVMVDDRDGRPRRRARFLAPVSAGIQAPASLLLVWMDDFDLVRTGRTPPTIRVAGRDVTIGRLPAAWLHRRHLVKYAGSVVTVTVNEQVDGPLPASDHTDIVWTADRSITQVSSSTSGHTAALTFRPAVPPAQRTPSTAAAGGTWDITVDGATLTGGSWSAVRSGARVELGMHVTRRWRPGRLPLLMRVVTTVVPVFRRWPTTYRWHARLDLGPPPSMRAGWLRVGSGGAEGYRRATSS